MSRPVVNFPIVLTRDVRQSIESMLLDPETRKGLIKRLKAILLMAESADTADVARLLGVNAPAVYRWRKAFAKNGLAGLCPERRPMPFRKYGPDVTEAILRIVETPPPPTARWWTAHLIAAQLDGVPWQFVSAFLRRRSIDLRAGRRMRFRY